MQSQIVRYLFPRPDASDRDFHVAGALGLSVVGVLAQGLTRLGYSILVARFAGKGVLGEVNLALSISTLAVMCWPQATGTAASKYLSMARATSDRDRQASVASYTATLAFMSGMILGIATGGLEVAVFDLPWYYAVSSAFFVLSLSLYANVRGARAGNNLFVASAAWDVITSVVAFSLLVVVLAAGWSTVLIWPLIVGQLVYAGSGWTFRRGRRPGRRTRYEIRTFVAWGSVQIVAAAGLLPLTLMVASGHTSRDELGEYAAAVALATPLGLIPIVVRTALAPSIARMFAAGDHAGVRTRVDVLMTAMVTAVVPIFGVAILWSEPVLRLLFDDSFASAATPLALLLFGVSFTTLNASHLRLNGTERRRVRTLAACHLVGLTVGVMTALSAVAPLGTTGAALGFLVGSAVSSFSAMTIVWRLDRMAWGAPALKLVVGYMLLAIALLWLGQDDALNHIMIATVVFISAWTAMTWTDVKLLLRLRPRGAEDPAHRSGG